MTAATLRRLLVGRKITGVRTRPFADGRGGKATQPEILLDNGLRMAFVTQETEHGEYGTKIVIQCLRGHQP